MGSIGVRLGFGLCLLLQKFGPEARSEQGLGFLQHAGPQRLRSWLYRLARRHPG
jgi:hypothetical protein